MKDVGTDNDFVPEQHWSRKGAHNIAGVSFQLAVTAELLIDGLVGGLPVASAIPEGFEDIDVLLRDSGRVLIQVKERSPSGPIGRSDLKKALRKKMAILAEDRVCRFALVTNAKLRSGLASTGWNGSVTESLDPFDVKKLVDLLQPDFADPISILSRTHIVQVESGVVERTRRKLEELPVVGNRPSVATLVYAGLVEQVTQTAILQRSTTPDTAHSLKPHDVETIATRVLETVDVDSLDWAIRHGIVEPVDFSVPADMSVDDFLAGVDVLPAHIAADLDLPRPAEVGVLVEALEEYHSALLIGPSGAGKSALMWRTAQTLSGRMRPYRLLRLLPEDVPTLKRWLRLQEPSEHFPLLLCADNLGRPAAAGWAELAREFIDKPGVLLLGACREEDYQPQLAVGRTTVVDPTLDRPLAEGIAGTLAYRGVQTVVDVAEAFEMSEGLLMEFLSMLLTGRRLRQVVEDQVAARFTENRWTEREVLRFVATAHSAGVAIPAEVLESLLPGPDLGPALLVLDREHLVIVGNGDRWQGLHELRSVVARDYLHQFPPPPASTTVRRLVEHLPVEDACRIIEGYARLDENMMPAAEGVSQILTSSGICAGDAARLIRSLAMADAFQHARACLEVIEGLRPSSLDPWNVLFLAYLNRFGGVSLDSLYATNPGFSRFAEIPAALPPRPPSLRDACVTALSPEAVHEVALRGTADEAAAWLESLEGSAFVPNMIHDGIWAHFAGAPLETLARLSATLRALAPADDRERLEDVFGSLHNRIHMLAAGLPDCIGAYTTDEPDGKLVSLRLLIPEDEETLHDRSVQTCRAILDLCPEADIAEVIVLTPDGDRHSIDGNEPGYKRIPRANLPRSPQTAGNANVLRAGRLLLASRYWTQPLRTLARASAELLALRDDPVAWLINPHHNTGRRRQAITLISSLLGALAALPGEPVGQDKNPSRSTARDALKDALTVVQDIAATSSPDKQQRIGFAAQCKKAVEQLIDARQGNVPILSTVGDPLPKALDEMLELLADLLLVQAARADAPSRPLRKGHSESWLDVAQQLVSEATSSGYEAEQAALTEALHATPGVEIQRIRRRDLGSALLLTDWWAVIIPGESDDPAPAALIEGISPEIATQLAFRTFVVLRWGGCILPLGGLNLGTSRMWPAAYEELLAIASGLGVQLAKSFHLRAWDEFVAELVRASRAAVLFRLRTQAGFTVDESSFRSALLSARRAAEACHPTLQEEAARLLEWVELEPTGHRQALAGDFYRMITHDEYSENMTVLVAYRLEAQAIDLSEGEPETTAAGEEGLDGGEPTSGEDSGPTV